MVRIIRFYCTLIVILFLSNQALFANLTGTGLLDDLEINEVLPQPTSDVNKDGTFDASQDEFIEIYNDGIVTLLLTGIKIKVDGNLVFHKGGISLNLLPGERIVIFGGGNPDPADFSCNVYTAGAMGLNLDDVSSHIELIVPILVIDTKVDEMTYSSSTPDVSWACHPDGVSPFVLHTTIPPGGNKYSPCLTNGQGVAASMDVNITVFLSGAYAATGDSMKTTLNDMGLLPLTQPYNTVPWNYAGTESVTIMPGDVVDWVLVRLRNSSNYSIIEKTQAGLLHSDGTITSVDGSPLNFRIDVYKDYYIEVAHRNHLAIMTAIPNDFSVPPVVDFTTSGVAYDDTGDSDAPQLEVEAGVRAMYAGNANSNLNIRYGGPASDRATLLNSLGGNEFNIIQNIYSFSDLNMDGITRYGGPASDRATLLNNLGGDEFAIILRQY